MGWMKEKMCFYFDSLTIHLIVVLPLSVSAYSSPRRYSSRLDSYEIDLKTLDQLPRTHSLESDLVDFLKQWVSPDPLSR